MENIIHKIELAQLDFHPDNPNRQSKANFAKLVRNIKRTGKYEPLVVRPSPENAGRYQLINGEHRCRALAELGYKTADCVIWDVDDEQADLFLSTLNRLGGSDVLDRKIKLLKKLNKSMGTAALAKLIPQTAKQIERLTNLQRPMLPQAVSTQRFAEPLVFFVSAPQKEQIEKALSLAEEPEVKMPRAARRAAALANIAQYFFDMNKPKPGGANNG